MIRYRNHRWQFWRPAQPLRSMRWAWQLEAGEGRDCDVCAIHGITTPATWAEDCTVDILNLCDHHFIVGGRKVRS